MLTYVQRSMFISMLLVVAAACGPFHLFAPPFSATSAFKFLGTRQVNAGEILHSEDNVRPSAACSEAFADSFEIKNERIEPPEELTTITTGQSAQTNLGGTYNAISAALGLDSSKKYVLKALITERATIQRKPGRNTFEYCCAAAQGNCDGSAYVSELGTIKFDIAEYHQFSGKLQGGKKYLVDGTASFEYVSSRQDTSYFHYARFSGLPNVSPIGSSDVVYRGPVYLDVGSGATGTNVGRIKIVQNARRWMATWTLASDNSVLRFEDAQAVTDHVTGACTDNALLDCSKEVNLKLGTALTASQQVTLSLSVQDKFVPGNISLPSVSLFLYKQPNAEHLKLSATPSSQELDLSDCQPRPLTITVKAPGLETDEAPTVQVLHCPSTVEVQGAQNPCTNNTCSLTVSAAPGTGHSGGFGNLVLGVSRPNIPGLSLPVRVSVKLPSSSSSSPVISAPTQTPTVPAVPSRSNAN